MALVLQPNLRALEELTPWRLEERDQFLPVSNPGAEFAVILFMAGGGSLASQVAPDVKEMLLGVKGGTEISVLAFVDKLGGESCEIIEVCAGGIRVLATCDSTDSGDPRPVADFLAYALGSFSEETKIAIGFWGHGNGVFGDLDPFENLLPDELLKLPLGAEMSETMFLEHYAPPTRPMKHATRSLMPDDTTGNSLTNRELNSALAVAFSRAGRSEPVDMIFFDTCLNGTIEVYTEIERYTKTFVGSALSIPGAGWNYTWFLQATRRAQPTTAEEWAEAAVWAYDKTYDQRFYPKAAQLAAFKTGTGLVDKLARVNSRLLELGPSAPREFHEALTGSPAVGHNETLDLYQLFARLEAFTEDSKLKEACGVFLESFRDSRISLSHPPVGGEYYTGLSIWCPILGDQGSVRQYYQGLQFDRMTSWFKVIEAASGAAPPTQTTLRVLCLNRTVLSEAHEVHSVGVFDSAEGTTLFRLKLEEENSSWSGSLVEGHYSFAQIQSITMVEPEMMDRFLEKLFDVRRLESEFTGLTGARKGRVLDQQTCSQLSMDFQKYENVFLDEFPEETQLYSKLLEFFTVAWEEDGFLVFL